MQRNGPFDIEYKQNSPALVRNLMRGAHVKGQPSPPTLIQPYRYVLRCSHSPQPRVRYMDMDKRRIRLLQAIFILVCSMLIVVLLWFGSGDVNE